LRWYWRFSELPPLLDDLDRLPLDFRPELDELLLLRVLRVFFCDATSPS